ncbi:hypothetical protein SBDP1_250020 [Syntrophobacter sp. SbD1]|nr:hypothetical protein SBDP1_250020 [Syntrophobacter sp. SbD1]
MHILPLSFIGNAEVDLQASLVYINTLMIQPVLGDPEWLERMTGRDLAALSPKKHESPPTPVMETIENGNEKHFAKTQNAKFKTENRSVALVS